MKHKYILSGLCLSFILGTSVPAFAQDIKTVTGVVVDESGQPIIGASVKAEGASTGTITDLDGKFTLSVPDNAKLTISYIGYITETVSNLNNPRVMLQEDQMKLDEVVVVGYGTQKMKNVTGAIEVIDAKDLEDLAVTSLGDALAGMVNGLHVNTTGNKPGSAAHLTIRQSTDYAKNWGQINAKVSAQDDTPLYVIDDFISSESAFNALDVSEVESITVLKDASAAVYGAQGAYGVILVKTKRGEKGAPRISYSGQFGFTDALQIPKMMDAYNYGKIWNAYQGTTTTQQDETTMKDYFQYDELEAMKNLDYNPLADEWSVALAQRHSLNISGGSDHATYFASVSYNTQDGNVGKLDYERWNFRAGINTNIGKWIKASLQVSGNYNDKKTPVNKYGSGSGSDSGDYMSLLEHPRFVPMTIDGLPIVYSGMANEANSSYGDAMYNFYAIQNASDYNESSGNGFNLDGSLEYDFGWSPILKGLKLKVSYSKHVSNSKSNRVATSIPVYRMINRGGSAGHLYTGEDIDYSIENFQELSLDNGNRITRSMSRGDSYQLNFTASYARQFGLHNVSALFSIERGESESEDINGEIASPLPFTDGQSSSATGEKTVDWSRSESGRLAYIGRFNYSYADKYLFEFLVRSDASTKFAPKNYWGTFPSVSAGWVISEEPWFNKEKTGIDFLKIRGSFGLMGRDNINAFVWLTRYSRDVNRGVLFGNNSTANHINPGMVTVQGGSNPDAHWDKTYKTNLGFDFRFFDSRLTANIDAYYDMGRDIFATHQGTKYFPMTVGIKPTAENFAAIDAWGTEITIGWRDKIGPDFTYWVKMSTGYSDNKVKKMAEKETPDRTDPRVGKRKDLGVWGYSCIGMFRSYQDIEEYFKRYGITEYMGLQQEAVHPGMLIYRDVCGAYDPETKSYDPKPDGVVDENDMVELSHRADNPYGVTLNFGVTYKSFSLTAQLGGSWGAYTTANTNIRKSAANMEYRNIPAFWKDMFVYQDVTDAQGYVIAEQNLDARYPNAKYGNVNNVESTFWRVSAAEVSLRNITVAYTLPKKWLTPVGISSCRLNLTCQNALNFVSPHIEDAWSSWGGNYGYYPNLRKITLGVNVSF